MGGPKGKRIYRCCEVFQVPGARTHWQGLQGKKNDVWQVCRGAQDGNVQEGARGRGVPELPERGKRIRPSSILERMPYLQEGRGAVLKRSRLWELGNGTWGEDRKPQERQKEVQGWRGWMRCWSKNHTRWRGWYPQTQGDGFTVPTGRRSGQQSRFSMKNGRRCWRGRGVISMWFVWNEMEWMEGKDG